MIGEPLETIFVVGYDVNWKKYFKDEKEHFKRFLPFRYVVEHVGSTSIPGMAARPIIDIMVGVGSEYDLITARDLFAANGYVLDEQNSHLGLYVFYRNIGNKRYFNIYLTKFNSASWNTYIGIRNYFLRNKNKAADYLKIKADLVKGVKNDKLKYESTKKRYLLSEVIPYI